jgi:endonuclease/exonuclease/phosphatase family metal-dependent hydrolase
VVRPGRRKVQAAAAARIYRALRKKFPFVLVAGDLNDHPLGGSLDALLARTDLVDAMSLKYYQGAFPGTYQRGTAKEKIDYLLLSPALRCKVEHVDVFCKGFCSPKEWESFENVTRENKHRFQASDHHCLWANVEI